MEILEKTKPYFVLIYGNVSSGKTPWANCLIRLCEKNNIIWDISDHELFTFDKNFKKKLSKKKNQMIENKVHLGIICIGTGIERNNPFRIEIEPDMFAPLKIMDLLTGNEVIGDF